MDAIEMNNPRSCIGYYARGWDILRTNKYGVSSFSLLSKDMESFATGLKRIKDACDKAGCRVEFQTPDEGFVVVFYRHGTQKLSGTAQKTAQKEEKTAQKTAQKEEKINALLEYCKEPRDRDEMMKFLGVNSLPPKEVEAS